MKTPPLLLGFALLFWGWQTGFLWVGALMGVVLEASRVFKARWEFSDEELRRIWTFCLLGLLAVMVFAFTSNDGPSSLGSLVTEGNLSAQRKATNAGAQTVMSVIRWSPMIFFILVAAQTYSTRMEIPLGVMSPFLWRRKVRAPKPESPSPFDRKINYAYPFFGMCLLAASLHSNEIPGFFWGASILITWALWPQRSRRFSIAIWAIALALAILLGFGGQRGLNQFQQFLTGRGVQWLAQFMQRGADPSKTTTQLGQVGRLNASGKIVIRLQTKPGQNPPELLREASYSNYRGTTWYAGVTRDAFEEVTAETNITSWILLRDKTNTASVNIACYLPGRKGLLPLPTGTARLDNLNVENVRKNPVGAVMAEGLGLAIFDANYAPGATFDSPPNATNDLRVPDKELNGITAVISELQISDKSDAEKLQQIQQFFQNKFQYSLWQEPPKLKRTNETALSRFLLETRSGHCEYFATATVLMLRKLGIPARYAIGYAVHEEAGANKYVVRLRDGHAWCLVWDGKTWVDFDTTPASFISEEEKRASKFQWLSDMWSRMWFEFAKFRWGQSHIRQYILWGLVPVLTFLLYQIIFKKSWRRRAGKSSGKNDHADWPGLDSEFYQLERRLKEFIGARRPDETLSDWLARAATEPALTGASGLLEKLLHLHYRHRFDPQGLGSIDRAALKETVKECLENLADAKSAHAS